MTRRKSSESEFGELGPAASAAGPASEHELPARIAGRFAIEALLGRGGMAAVYRARDLSSGAIVALKQLAAASGGAGERATLFEREYHLLSQLTHPRVIAVYDYGLDPAGPWYTMELLDGGDLRELSPLPWQRACALAYDVGSALALLHSRRFVHRDLSPRNVRCTRDGSAKLIDFGALAPIGVATRAVGTPAFVPPEVVSRALLDARTDLYSLGATLYYALTGEPPYPAASFNELAQSWSHKPYPPSAYAEGVPVALDELVMSLVSLDPSLRPRSAFEVMQRLSAIAGLTPAESIAVPRAYLTAPVMVGREAARRVLCERIEAALARHGSATSIEGELGSGCSRMLDAAALEGKTRGALVLRGGAQAGARVFATVQQLMAQLIEALPELVRDQPEASVFESDRPVLRNVASALERAQLHAALLSLVMRLSQKHALLFAVDDLHDVDAASVAWLAALAHAATNQRVLLVLAAESGAPLRGEDAYAVLQSHSQRLALEPLTGPETEALIQSLFGDVPNLALVSHRIHELARGNPGRTLGLAQWLVDEGLIRYSSGAWSLPEQLRAAEMPIDPDLVRSASLARLSPLAGRLARMQALAALGTFQRADYAALAPEADAEALERALNELLLVHALISEGDLYQLASRGLREALLLQLTEAEERAAQRALARMYEQPGKPAILAVQHLLAAGQEVRALERLLVHNQEEDALGEQLVTAIPVLPYRAQAALYTRTLEIAEQRGCAPRALREYRRRLVLVSTVGDDSMYWRSAPAWLEQLRADSGLALWQASDLSDPGERLSQALNGAFERYAALPEAERPYRPDEAIQYLVHYVVMSIVIGSRSLLRDLVQTLPGLLQPFVPLSGVLDAMWKNATAVCENHGGRLLAARARWLDVHAQLASLSGDDLRYVDAIRNAIAFGIGAIEASLGLPSAKTWATQLDEDPLQRVNAMYLRKLVALQQGDWESADRYRKRADLLAVQAASPQMFTHMLPAELGAHARASDLAGVQHMAERIERLAAHAPSWVPITHLARGHFQQLRGDAQQARQEFERCVELCDPRAGQRWPVMLAFCPAAAAYVESLIEVGEADLASSWGERALATMRELGVDAGAWELERALALAEGRLGAYDSAVARLTRLLDAQRELGVRGLHLGASYEARVRIAIWKGDTPAIEEYGALTAGEYRHGLGSPLGARYERLLEEANRAGATELSRLADLSVMSGTESDVWPPIREG